MDKNQNTYCRFCAEIKDVEKLLNLAEDEKKIEEITTKLIFLNAIYVDVTNKQNMLPKTVCYDCYNSLNQAYDFLCKIKQAQRFLIKIFDKSKCDNYDLSEDQMSALDDFFGSDDAEENATEVKRESAEIKNHLDDQYKINVSVEVKQELKEEVTDTSVLLDMALNTGVDADNYDSNIDMQDLLSAAMHTDPYTSNVTIYAKELSDVRKKTIKTWKEYPWVCGYCNIEFLDITTLRSHSKVVHGKCTAFVCVDCKKFDGMAEDKSDGFNHFIDHVKKHRKSLRLHCHYCDIKLDKTDSLAGHLKLHFQRSQIACPSCGEILKSEEALQKHAREYKNVKQKRKPRRKRGTPITVDDLTCKLCHKVYKNPNSLRDHAKLHTADRKRNYTCDRCGKTFYNKGTLTSHIMSHDKIRPHICRICDRSFLYPNMLRRHVLMHSNIKPFSCEQCGRCFRLQYQLNAHKIIHTDAMPFVCQYCFKAFRFKQILKNHERQHTGAKPYACQQCGMEFTNWSNYNKHMKRRHGTDTSKKKITPDGVFPVNPETGQIVQVVDPVGTEEWKTKIMIPGKRGKKKAIKQESLS